MIIEGTDGKTHINIYSLGRTEVGRWLSNFYRQPFSLPRYGSFECIEGLWYYLGTHDERLRTLVGIQAKRLGKSLGERHRMDEGAFRQVIRDAIDLKLKGNRPFLDQLVASPLPLCHYYDYAGKRVDAGYEWIVWHIKSRRKLVREARSKPKELVP